VVAPLNRRPAGHLWWSGFAQGGAKPIADRWREALKHVSHDEIILLIAHMDKNMCAGFRPPAMAKFVAPQVLKCAIMDLNGPVILFTKGDRILP
jgi:hypothetical protein